MVEKKTSVRSQDPGQRRVLDPAARQRRINRQLEALENDSFQDDPHAGLPQLGKWLPQFDDDADTGKKKKETRGDHFKLRFRRNFQALLGEQNPSVAEGPNYLTACEGPPSRPQRPFCAVCGFPSPYTRVSRGARYCTVPCLGTRQETRCLKWTVRPWASPERKALCIARPRREHHRKKRCSSRTRRAAQQSPCPVLQGDQPRFQGRR